MCLLNEEPQEVTFRALHVVIFEESPRVWQEPQLREPTQQPKPHCSTCTGTELADVATAASISQRSWVSIQFTPSRRGRDTGSNMETRCPLYGHSPKEASWVSDAAKGKASFWKSGHFQDTRVDMEPGHLAAVT